MPANKLALLRYHIIDGKLNKRFPDYPTKEDLRRECEDELYGTRGKNISISTIEKDIYAMKNERFLGFYAPIAYSRTHEGYYYTEPNYTLADIPLTEVDMEALYFAANILSQFRGLKVFRQFEHALDKISDVVRISRAIGDDLDNNPYIQFEKAPYFKGSHLLTDLVVAIKDKKVVNVLHKRFSREKASDHVLHPYLVKEFRNRWYVIGWLESAEAIRTFGLDRIEEVTAVPDAVYRENEDFDAEDFFKYVYGISQPDGKPVKVVLRFTEMQGKYVKTKPIHESQEIVKESAGKLVVSLKVVLNYEFIHQVLSYSDQVKVLQPSALQKEIQKKIKAMGALYR